MPIFDTHAHYDSGGFHADRDAVLSALPAAGVGLVVGPGCDVPSSRATAVASSNQVLMVVSESSPFRRARTLSHTSATEFKEETPLIR